MLQLESVMVGFPPFLHLLWPPENTVLECSYYHLDVLSCDSLSFRFDPCVWHHSFSPVFTNSTVVLLSDSDFNEQM